MLNDIGAAMKRREHIDEAKELDFEMLVPHRERHHPLVEAGFAKERLGMLIDQFENALAASLDFSL